MHSRDPHPREVVVVSDLLHIGTFLTSGFATYFGIIVIIIEAWDGRSYRGAGCKPHSGPAVSYPN